MKIVLDTNVWLPSFFWNGEAGKITDGRHDIFVSEFILQEITGVLDREAKFSKFLPDKKRNIEDLIRTILSITSLLNPKTKLDVIKKHPADNAILALALESKSSHIVSYNKHLLDLVEYKGIRILHPTDFLKIKK